MGADRLKMNRLRNGEAQNNLPKQRDRNLSQGFNGGVVNLASDGSNARPYYDGNSGEASDGLKEILKPDVVCKWAGKQKEMTLEDMYGQEMVDDDDDDDDSDWEPIEKCVKIMKWFCTNCTMVNVDGVIHCKKLSIFVRLRLRLSLRGLIRYFTPDTYANEHSACSAGLQLVRPPGHHAGVRQAKGFCLHNNAALAALAAQVSGARKVLTVDWIFLQPSLLTKTYTFLLFLALACFS
ncbi:Histone deacetylase [Quillaja saponaria]|uniref:histone deacetylase n=1 Tax=Quillaja saponaria TaxID=32244 RepID=A0AAD7QCJ9_QUISA|nr:Histone deacetylase [Quillaja saponaria]